MNHWIMDYETLSNCFVGVFKHYKTEEIRVFSICKLQNDYEEFKDDIPKLEKTMEMLINVKKYLNNVGEDILE